MLIISTTVSCCAITSHPLLCGCRRWRCRCCQCQCCGQKLTSKLCAWISRDHTSKFFWIFLDFGGAIFYWDFWGFSKDFSIQSAPNFQNRAYFSKQVEMSPTDKRSNISVDAQPICTKLSEQGSFF